MRLNRRILLPALTLLAIILLSLLCWLLFFQPNEYEDASINELRTHPRDYLGKKIQTSGIVNYFEVRWTDFINGDFFVELPSGMIGIPVYVRGKQQLPSKGSAVEVHGNLVQILDREGSTLYFNASSWHYTSASYENVREATYVMIPVIIFFLIFVAARTLGGLLGYFHISYRKLNAELRDSKCS